MSARWASTNEVHMNETATRVIENLIVTNGSGDQLSKLIHRMRAMKFEDLEESYFTQAIDTNTKIDEAPPTFVEWISRYGWTGDQIRTLYEKAAKSTLNSTGKDHNSI